MRIDRATYIHVRIATFLVAITFSLALAFSEYSELSSSNKQQCTKNEEQTLSNQSEESTFIPRECGGWELLTTNSITVPNCYRTIPYEHNTYRQRSNNSYRGQSHNKQTKLLIIISTQGVRPVALSFLAKVAIPKLSSETIHTLRCLRI